ncbi:MAG TPA: BNR-4 repeat-containing protein [Actinokineospora sp.]|nr:BNR-4 repeat-containing protein [Actinokineospora sp.]
MTDNSALSRRAFARLAAGAALSVPIIGASAGLAEAADPARTIVGPKGAWCWFGDPRAVHYQGTYKRTYIGYINSLGEIVVAQYDHTTNQLTRTVVQTGFQIDDHNNPCLVIRPDRRVVLFWTGHNQTAGIFYRRSSRPEDISSFESVKKITTNVDGGSGTSYTHGLQLSTEPWKLYLFFRGANFKPCFTTTTGSDIWTPAKTMISAGDGHRPYFKTASNGVDKIHFAFTNGHPRDYHNNIYYMYYSSVDKNLHKADGTVIGPWGTTIRPDQGDLVYDATNRPKAWIHDVAEGKDGKPVLVYANFPTNSDHRYRYARWTGTSWFDTEIVAAGPTISGDLYENNYSGGITLDDSDPSVVLLSRQVTGGRHEIERWRTANGGVSWTSEAITSGSTVLNVRPVKPVGMTENGPMSVLWMRGEYPSYTNWKTDIMGVS